MLWQYNATFTSFLEGKSTYRVQTSCSDTLNLSCRSADADKKHFHALWKLWVSRWIQSLVMDYIFA